MLLLKDQLLLQLMQPVLEFNFTLEVSLLTSVEQALTMVSLLLDMVLKSPLSSESKTTGSSRTPGDHGGVNQDTSRFSEKWTNKAQECVESKCLLLIQLSEINDQI